ncbi:ycfI, putative structural proteins [Parvularcula bermudensis HTCC2503]|uniref:YcfI, putative structural proteins n=1 Tax=Parvularcula bermudensis (strain ATCC BAA-594 / HTCC2503 / KCTC 12087) TaxID=314260 RepID=E0TEY5_PARBH|nr:ferritin-like domain-containing protein [Parvularcula bermudensis]ADM10078.1 ycfI, putative structural proteins [Parvularcula bermudensis HTCC2503]
MTLATLKDVYIDQLQDVYSANRQSQKATEKLINAATDADLKAALQRSLEGTNNGIEIVADLVKGHDAEPTGEFCKGMEGIVKEVNAHVLEADFSDNDVRDAMIITQYQRMAHYAIAGYGCVVAFARRLGLSEEASKLQKCLDETYSGDRTFSDIAENGINRKAAA